MRQVVEKFNVYTYETATPEIKENIKNFIIENWNLYEHCMEERIKTLYEFAALLDGKLDYSLSCVPSRGEFISVNSSSEHYGLNYDALLDLVNTDYDAPLTGCYYDHNILDYIKENCIDHINVSECIDAALNGYIKSIHDEYEAMCKDEYIKDLCEANEYEFTKDGRLY